MHAGLLVAVADTIMGHTAQRALGPDARLVTVCLTTDFTSSAQAGDWIKAHATRPASSPSPATSILPASGVFAIQRQAAAE